MAEKPNILSFLNFEKTEYRIRMTELQDHTEIC